MNFSCDYNCGAAPQILEALTAANSLKHGTYGFDTYCDSAKEKIKAACGNPDADIYFVIGGTQANSTVLAYFLRPWQGALCVETGHIATHESGAVEHDGHKVLPVAPSELGKIDIAALRKWLVDFYEDETYPHMVQPGAVYISHPTEFGGIYSKSELEEIRSICDEYKLKFYIDGARLAYGLAAEGTDVTLKDIAALSDAFYIGGTKCGSYMGEAIVFKETQPDFFTFRKQHGALLAKGWLLGLQYDVLFTDDLYGKLGQNAIDRAVELKKGFVEKGIKLYCDSPTNQQFVYLTDEQNAKIEGKAEYAIFCIIDGAKVYRFCTSWATTKEEVEDLLALL